MTRAHVYETDFVRVRSLRPPPRARPHEPRAGRVSRPLQARAKRNAIVHAATSAPRSLIVNRSFHHPTPSSARSSPVVRPNARLRLTRHRVTFVGINRVPRVRCRAAETSIRPTSASRPHVSRPALSRAAGRCTVRRHHRNHRDERHAPPPQSVRRPHGGRSASRPRTTSTARSSSMGESALQLTQRRAAPSQARSFIARRCATERGEGEREKRRRSPRRALQANQTPLA
jgi:hypothetical protein